MLLFVLQSLLKHKHSCINFQEYFHVPNFVYFTNTVEAMNRILFKFEIHILLFIHIKP